MNLPSEAQNLLNSRKTSYFTYIYQLKDREALTVYKKGLQKVDENFFHTLVLAYPTDSVADFVLPPGHYLKAWAKEENLNFELISISNLQLELYNNGADFNLILHDEEGKEIKNAKVSVGGKRIHFNPETESFSLKKSNKKGILEIDYEGVKTFTYLDRQLRNSRYKRFTRKIFFTTPLKYIAIPANLIIRSPYDLYLTVKRGYPAGLFYYVSKPFKDIVHSIQWGDPQGFVEKVFCVFDDYHCEYEKWDGYFIFNKPKFQPGDTLYFKAYITTRKGRPIKKPLDVSLSNNSGHRSRKHFGKLSPYRPGGYESHIVLHDSLQLRLDSEFTVSLNKRFKTLSSGRFKYEEYELKGNQYEFRADKNEHYAGQPLNLYASGTDINGMSLFDVRLELLVLNKNVEEIFIPQVTLPDTLWKHELKLESIGETKIALPDSIFKEANVFYTLKADFLNSENEKISKELKQTFFYKKDEIHVEAQNDSILISHRINGEDVGGAHQVEIFNKQQNLIADTVLALPAKTKLNPYASEYVVKNGPSLKRWGLKSTSSLLSLQSHRTADSVLINVENPRKLFFRYNIYKENAELKKGSGYQLNIGFKNKTSGNYFVSLSYIWGGEVVTENYEIGFKEKQLQIKVFEPGTVFPGQEAEIKILVHDASGNPVKGADLSAFSFTKKFENYNVPKVPYFGKTHQGRKQVNGFYDRGNLLADKTHSKLLDWQAWNLRMSLDTIEYFRFLFPNMNYSTAIPVPDKITQFAPFLIKEGKIEPVHIIYLDNKPIYFSFANQYHRYSFQASPGYHQLRLRTKEHEVRVDSVYMHLGSKNIFSFLLHENNTRIKLVEKKVALSDHEYNLILNHVIAVENDYYKKSPEFMRQDSSIFWINHPGNANRNAIIGPLKKSNTSYVRHGQHSVNFGLEPRYHYVFSKNLVKMKYGENLYIPKHLSKVHNFQSLNDFYLTEKELSAIHKKSTTVEQSSWRGFDNPSQTSNGKGKITTLLYHTWDMGRFLKNLIVMKDNEPQFLRIYSGKNVQTIHDLSPGYYTVYALLDDNSYFKRIAINVSPHATTYIDFIDDAIQQPDEMSIFINDKIREIQSTNYIGKKDVQQINAAVREEERVNRYGSETIYGKVMQDDGWPIPGANIIIKGTAMGTVSDMEGNFMISVPSNYFELVFSAIGYMTEEVQIGAANELNILLKPDIRQLSEVVVIGYSSEKRLNMTSSITSIQGSGFGFNNVLQGRVAGVMSGSPSVRIRGSNSITGSDEPLYVINGVPYSGKDLTLDPSQISSMEILDGATAAAIYGSSAANGVVILNLKDGSEILKSVIANNTFMEAMEASSSIRNNFSDYAFWQPRLITDQKGMASFKVKFPDDITAWNTYVVGMTRKRQSGKYAGEIKSFKTVAGTLVAPTFITEGDTIAVIGKTLNYTSDTLDISMKFELNGALAYQKEYRILNSKIDTFLISPPLGLDSVQLQYVINKADGYFDGELKTVNVVKKGTKETVGSFWVLDSDTTINYQLPFSDKPFKVSATSNVLQVLIDEAENIRRYEYLCNEQMASKVKALIALKKIREHQEDKFEYDGLVKKLVNNLQKNQRKNLWGWWEGSSPEYWISKHVLEALFEAEKLGYQVKLDKTQLTDYLIYDLENSRTKDQLRILEILSSINAKIDYQAQLNALEKNKLSFSEHLQVQLLKQKLKMPYTLDSLTKNKKETMAGGVYWEEQGRHVYRNSVVATIYAYQLIKNANQHQELLPGIRNFFLEKKRQNGYWRNTYEASNILETILPDLLPEGKKVSSNTLVVNGGKEVKEFPYEETFDVSSSVSISKKGTGPVFMSVHQEFWNKDPKAVNDDFEISTFFENNKTTFTAGKEEVLKIKLQVKKDAEFVMIEVPVPAGFSYPDKRQHRNESHREYFRNKVNIYVSELPAGNYEYEIKLLPRFSGSFHLNPARVEMMYFPVFYGRNEPKRVKVE